MESFIWNEVLGMEGSLVDRTKETPRFWSRHWRECLGGMRRVSRKEVESPEAGRHLGVTGQPSGSYGSGQAETYCLSVPICETGSSSLSQVLAGKLSETTCLQCWKARECDPVSQDRRSEREEGA